VPDPPAHDHERRSTEITEQIGAKEDRKLKAREKAKHSIWFGLGMFGVVGWSVAIPALIGVAVGLWLDRTFPNRISWTLTCMFLGLAIGAMIAWNWVKKEGKPD
jgi:ATP synthase protein I